MSSQIVTITHSTRGIDMLVGNRRVGWANQEYLAEAHAQAILAAEQHERQISEVREILSTIEKRPEVGPVCVQMISDIRAILNS